MSEKYYIRYVTDAGPDYTPKSNLYWGGQYYTWVSLEEAISYTREEAFKKIGMILCEREEISELINEKDLPTWEQLEADKLVADLKKEHYSTHDRDLMIEKCLNLWDRRKINHEVFAMAISRIFRG